MEIKEIIAMRICLQRHAKKLTKRQLARKCGLQIGIIDEAETGRKHISIETLNEILNGLDISLRDFLGKKIFQSWLAESPWKEYFYNLMHKSVYLYFDQPTTCPCCGSRPDTIFEYSVLLRYASLNQCFNKNCRLIFMMKADWDEIKEAIAVISGKWEKNLPLEDYI